MPKKLTCIDITHPNDYLKDGIKFFQLESSCAFLGIDFEFVLGDTLKIQIPDTELLFIDTLHTYVQLSQELSLHANNVKKWIIIHDTESCGDYTLDSVGTKVGGLKYAIEEFLDGNKDWRMVKQYTNNNGLTILERKDLGST